MKEAGKVEEASKIVHPDRHGQLLISTVINIILLFIIGDFSQYVADFHEYLLVDIEKTGKEEILLYSVYFLTMLGV